MLHKDNPCQSLKSVSCSLTVAPSLWNFPGCLFGSLLSLDFCLVTYFSTTRMCQSFVWLVFTFILRVFASFHRFHILALGHLVAFCIEPSVGVFGSLIVQSTSWLLFCTCSVVVKAFYCVIWAIYLFFSWISLGFVLGLDHTAHWGLCDFSWFERLLWCSGTWLCFHWVKVVFFYSLILSLKICLVHFAIEKKTNNLFCVALVNGN